jgi:DNA modification methylase
MVFKRSASDLNETSEVLRTVSHLSRKAVTFKGGRDRLAHKWYRLTPSYSPELVTRILEEFGNKHTRVLDPFSGRGTTAIECQIQNIPCLGIEINPMLQFAGRVSLNWSINSSDFAQTAEKLIAEFAEFKKKNLRKTSLEIAELYGVGFPQIHNVHRWWREDVLCDLLILKGVISTFDMSDQMRDLFFLNLSNIIVDVANITLGRLQLHFIDRDNDEIDSLDAFKKSCQSVANDLLELNKLSVENGSKIILGDSTQMASLIDGYDPNLIITSPPYPNRYSYVWNTRPHLYFMDFFTTPREAGNLDADTIGGTWGTATSRHMKGKFQYTDETSAGVISPIVDEIREKDLLMSNYVAMYFDDMYRHILQLNQCIKSGAVCAYVVGNSRIKKSIVETDVILGDLFKSCGYRLIRFEEIRRRNSGKELHETVVFAEKY